MALQDVLSAGRQRYQTWLDSLNQWNPNQATIGRGSEAIMQDMLQSSNAEAYLSPYWYDYYQSQAAQPYAGAALNASQNPNIAPGASLPPAHYANYFRSFAGQPYNYPHGGAPPTYTPRPNPGNIGSSLQSLLAQMNRGRQLSEANATGMTPEQQRDYDLNDVWLGEQGNLISLLSQSVGGSPFADYLRKRMQERLTQYQNLPPGNNWLQYVLGSIPNIGLSYG